MNRGPGMRNNAVDTATLQNELLDLVAEEAVVDRDTLKTEARLDELDIASADFVMILMAIEEKYGVYISVDNEIAELQTVQDLLSLVSAKIQADLGDSA